MESMRNKRLHEVSEEDPRYSDYIKQIFGAKITIAMHQNPAGKSDRRS